MLSHSNPINRQEKHDLFTPPSPCNCKMNLRIIHSVRKKTALQNPLNTFRAWMGNEVRAPFTSTYTCINLPYILGVTQTIFYTIGLYHNERNITQSWTLKRAEGWKEYPCVDEQQGKGRSGQEEQTIHVRKWANMATYTVFQLIWKWVRKLE